MQYGGGVAVDDAWRWTVQGYDWLKESVSCCEVWWELTVQKSSCWISVWFCMSFRGGLSLLVALFVRLMECRCDVGVSRSSSLVSGILMLLCKEFVVVEV